MVLEVKLIDLFVRFLTDEVVMDPDYAMMYDHYHGIDAYRAVLGQALDKIEGLYDDYFSQDDSDEEDEPFIPPRSEGSSKVPEVEDDKTKLPRS